VYKWGRNLSKSVPSQTIIRLEEIQIRVLIETFSQKIWDNLCHIIKDGGIVTLVSFVRS
jgi:hypothetical protein